MKAMKARPLADSTALPAPTRVLVVDDDERSRNGLVRLLQRDGYDVAIANDGQAAIDILLAPDSPQIALIDWEMPRLDGIHVCWAVRSIPSRPYTYIIMVTAKAEAADALAAFSAGVDDFLTKPMDSLQLLARLRCGERVLGLEKRCADRIAELDGALAEVRELKSLLPICMSCERVRNADNEWEGLATYVRENADTDYSRLLCPACVARVGAGDKDAKASPAH